MNGQPSGGAPGHAFISYVHEDHERVNRLQTALEGVGIRVWRDTANLWPGQDWKIEIRNAITGGSLAFIACFSENTAARVTSYQNEELVLAVEQMRLRPPGHAWLIPVRFAECATPEFELGPGRTLDSLQRIDLFDGSWELGVRRLVGAVLRILHPPEASPSPGPTAPAGATGGPEGSPGSGRPQQPPPGPARLAPHAPLTGHMGGKLRGGSVWWVGFSPDGRMLVTACNSFFRRDRAILLWNPATGEETGAIPGHRGVKKIAFSADGKIITTGAAGTHFWEPVTGRPLRSLDHVKGTLFSPDDRILSQKYGLQMWDSVTGKRIAKGGRFGTVAFSPDGRMLATRNYTEMDDEYSSDYYNITLELWDSVSGKHLRTLKRERDQHSSSVCGWWPLAFSPDGSILAEVAGWVNDRTVRLWEPSSGKQLHALMHSDPVHRAVFSPAGDILATISGDKTLQLWSPATGQPLRSLHHAGRISTLVFSPDGSTLASASAAGTVMLWDTTKRELIRNLPSHHTKRIKVMAFSPDGRMLATGSDDKTVGLWEPDPGA